MTRIKCFASVRKYDIVNNIVRRLENTMRKYRIGNAFPMGATVISPKIVQFVVQITANTDMALVLYEKGTGNKEVLKFTKEFQIGNLYSMIVEDIEPAKYTYNFMIDGKEVTDLYAKSILGNEIWGENKATISAGIGLSRFNWEEDKPIMTPYNESIIYQLHVRGFTKHTSSKVKKKGTFEGICGKIPYLQELGITAVELMPAYEFLEYEKEEPRFLTMDYVKENYDIPLIEKEKSKINYWGYKKAFYFVPKASYSGEKNPSLSFKKMVKELHKAGIEVIMQFYFPTDIVYSYLLEVLKYWVQEYHIDGVRLLGIGIPVALLATEPALCNTKIMYEYIPCHEIYHNKPLPVYQNLAEYNDGYLYAMRSFLKGDIGSLGKAFEAFLKEPQAKANIVYLTNYNSFTLKDMVSYYRKHNEENGENGEDGNYNNITWNCGVEGPSRKKNITLLREKQLRNAMTMLLLAKGTPVFVAGDEFGNSQGGNNNPYCQDNQVTWLNWKDLTKNKKHFEFTKKLIALSKEQKILKKNVVGQSKRVGVEYPYLSFHGKDAWKLEWNQNNKEAGGILYYSEYTYVYICFNMNWQETKLALPNIPGKHQWEVLLNTEEEETEQIGAADKMISLASRSIKIMIAKGKEGDFDEKLSAF